MGQVIAVTSGKGGTGKTTLCAAVATCLAAEGHKVLCIDVDLGLRNLDSARPFFIQFNMTASEREFYEILFEEIRKPIDPMELVYPKELPLFDKYDEYLPEELVKKGFACGVLDLDGLRERILGWREEQAAL